MRRITHDNGVGVHRIYTIYDDLQRVGRITHWNRAGHWDIKDWSGRTIASRRNSHDAVTFAKEHPFPAPLELHEELVLLAIDDRRLWAEGYFHAKLAEALRAIVAGSNSARAEAEELLTRIENISHERDAEVSAMQFQPTGLRPIPTDPRS